MWYKRKITETETKVKALRMELEDLQNQVNNIKYFLRSPNRYQDWD